MKILKNFKVIVALILALAAIGVLIGYCSRVPSSELTRPQMLQLLDDKLITRAAITPMIYQGFYGVEGTYLPKPGAKPKAFTITTHLDEKQVKSLLAQSNAKVDLPGQGGRSQIINIVSTIIIVGLIGVLVVHQMRIGKAKTSHKIKLRPSTRFRDVAGIEEAKAEVQEIVDFLRNPRKYKRLGGNLPKGVLLIGPPGTGKTMLAKAIAGEAEAHFFSAHGSDFNEVFVGVGAKRVREIFRQAAKNKPAIIFIDEIDCLGKSRKFDTHGEMQQTINALLAAMDGFESNDGIVMIAATNRPEDLDEALLRPGRFDRKVHVPLPDMKGRLQILKAHGRNKPIENQSKALEQIAKTTPGMSGADLANLINEAAIFCAQQNANRITLVELEASRDKVRFGKERKSMVLKKEEREMVAYHEAGHTIINLHKSLLPPLYKVSIIPRGNALGVTTLLPDEDQNIHSKEVLLQQLTVLMGGRAAEKVFYGATTNGANGDLNMAKDIARRMIHEWGMGERLYYEDKRQGAEEEINRLLEDADDEALAIIRTQREQTKILAEALLERETLTRDEVIAVLKLSATKSGKIDYARN
ncbi:MAG TPA: AAA family ATPase [Verrucomicrobiae bacterium]|nr:AAA family ATPase [Verrucomicrobiae bacterium]